MIESTTTETSQEGTSDVGIACDRRAAGRAKEAMIEWFGPTIVELGQSVKAVVEPATEADFDDASAWLTTIDPAGVDDDAVALSERGAGDENRTRVFSLGS